MRLATLVALALSVGLATMSMCCDGKLRRDHEMDEEEEFRPRLYREYAVRSERGGVLFDDYGFLRYGRSDE
uniref:Sulfakinin n=1 Tax=Cydia pomonella TaxID=82600 RepID=A0A514YLN7_CYDPO|nr:sulfakinin [Cydia pomonella]